MDENNSIGQMNEMINELYDTIQNAKNVMLSSEKCIIVRDDALDMLDTIVSLIPTEVENARKIMDSRNELVSQGRREAESAMSSARTESENLLMSARSDADRTVNNAKIEAERILNEARSKAEEMVSKESICREAQAKADETIRAANRKMEDLKKTSVKFMDDALAETEKTIADSLKEVRTTRSKFNMLLNRPVERKTDPIPAPAKNSPFIDDDDL